MEVFNGSWEAIAQGRADIVIGATSAVPVGGDFEVKDMGQLDWAFVMSPSHPCVREQNLNEEFVSQYIQLSVWMIPLACCLSATQDTTPIKGVCCYLTGIALLNA